MMMCGDGSGGFQYRRFCRKGVADPAKVPKEAGIYEWGTSASVSDKSPSAVVYVGESGNVATRCARYNTDNFSNVGYVTASPPSTSPAKP